MFGKILVAVGIVLAMAGAADAKNHRHHKANEAVRQYEAVHTLGYEPIYSSPPALFSAGPTDITTQFPCDPNVFTPRRTFPQCGNGN